MSAKLLGVGCLLAALGVILGAFAAHGIAFSERQEEVWEIASRYHMYHSFALILVGILNINDRDKRFPATCFLGGVFVFCGSLYLLALTGIKWLGAITPIGGLGFIVGWLTLGLRLIIKKG